LSTFNLQHKSGWKVFSDRFFNENLEDNPNLNIQEYSVLYLHIGIQILVINHKSLR